jgi:ankyrin repeat protein
MTNTFPLHIACQRGKFEYVYAFIKNNKRAARAINQKDTLGNPPLYYALENLAIVHFLITNGANVNDTEQSGDSILMSALYSIVSNERKIPILVIECLINNGADVNFIAKDGVSCAHFAAKQRNYKLAELILTKCKHINRIANDGFTPFMYMNDNTSVMTAKSLVSHGAGIKCHVSGMNALFNIRKNKPLFEYLISIGLDIHAKVVNGIDLCMFYAKYDHPFMLKMLYEKYKINTNNNVGYFGLNCLHYAVLLNHIKIVQILITNNADLNVQYAYNYDTVINDILDVYHASTWTTAGTPENEKEKNLWVGVKYLMTPLHMAIVKKHTKIAKMLIDAGANLEIRDSTGKTPLDYAIEMKDNPQNALKMLL